MSNNDNSLKAINVIHYNGSSIGLNNLCMSHTNFQSGEILEIAIYEDMIMIIPALRKKVEQ